jgi:carbon monoxide dehydrogenase subunit G
MPVLAPLVAFLALTPAVVGLTDGELQTALRGDVPTRSESFTTPAGKNAGRGVGAITIDRPMREVWATLTHYEDRAEYIPRLKSVAVLEKREGAVRVRQEVDASITTARYTAWYKLDEAAHVIHWILDDTATDNTIAAVDGDYRLFEVAPNRTLLVYRTYVDSGRAVPRFIQSYLTQKSIPDLLRAIKKRVESGGTWKK